MPPIAQPEIIDVQITDEDLIYSSSLRNVYLMIEALDSNRGLWLEAQKTEIKKNVFKHVLPAYRLHESGQCMYSYCFNNDKADSEEKLVKIHIYDLVIDFEGFQGSYLVEMTVNYVSQNKQKKRVHPPVHKWIKHKVQGIPRPEDCNMQIKFKLHHNTQNTSSDVVRQNISENIVVMWTNREQDPKRTNVRVGHIPSDYIMACVLVKYNVLQLYAGSNNSWLMSKRKEYDWTSALLYHPSPEHHCEEGDDFYVGCRLKGALKVIFRLRREKNSVLLQPLSNLDGKVVVTMLKKTGDNLTETVIGEEEGLNLTRLRLKPNSIAMLKLYVNVTSIQRTPRVSISSRETIRWSGFLDQMKDEMLEEDKDEAA